MAHHIRIKSTPHTNKDGRPSKTKRDYTITDRHRGTKRVIGTATSLLGANEVKADEWRRINTERGIFPELQR